jgi:hypothetical protein
VKIGYEEITWTFNKGRYEGLKIISEINGSEYESEEIEMKGASYVFMDLCCQKL